GTVWVAAQGASGRLCAIQKDKVQCRGEDGSLGRGVFGLYEDSKNRLWSQVNDGIWRWKPDPKFYSLPGASDLNRGLAEQEDGTILIGTPKGIQRFVDGKTEPYSLPGNFQTGRISDVFRDRGGSLWIGTVSNGLVHLHQGRVEAFTQADGLSGDLVA